MFKKQGGAGLAFNPLQEIGGKAHGLITAQEILAEFQSDVIPDIKIDIPDLIVIGTSVFDAFMHRNQLFEIAFSNSKDSRIAHAFQQASLPFEILGELRKLVEKWSMPLAVRSSGLLEDTQQQPFAGVYATKMIPNNALNFETRFQKLVEAIKFVWASTFFMIAKDYSKAVHLNIQDEKMAIILQKMVGERHQNRFYPVLSGVARSYNFYPIKPANPEDGVVNLALGLGKTVVDGGKTWTYSPGFPKAPAPFNSTEDLLHETQNEYWVVNMSEGYEYNPIKETEYMQKENLLTAEKDGVLDLLVSTFELQTGRLSTGVGVKGPRVLTFAPLLEHNFVPVNDLLVKLLEKAESKFSSPVEIEFAMTFNPHQFSLLQVRPMKVKLENFQISEKDLKSKHNIITSKFVLGNGVLEGLQDIVFVRPE
ncbi:MAG TPA: PEP/pyruvate-binding domain-containing protein, partial [Anaerolineaceae bacterium]|nr:PEP/pyruvate-binding domain-containing protein [Anaerolineaceae bacterium]